MAKTFNEPSNVSADMLTQAADAVKHMWEKCSELSSRVHAPAAEDAVHFLHEELCEVVKCGMAMGLMGRKDYSRSDEAEAQKWDWKRMIGEVGDVLLMAMSLAQGLDVDPSVCLQESIDKFYVRARRDAAQVAGPLQVGLSIIESDALARARDCVGFAPGELGADDQDYCQRCRAHKDLHTIKGRSKYVLERRIVPREDW